MPAPTLKTRKDATKAPPQPFWKSPLLWLILVPALLYSRILFFEFTALDDQFFVIDHAAFNHHLGNLFQVFHQGLFVPKNDIYYRPLFLVDMILENQLFGTSPWGYHLMSLVFHILSVCLLFIFLKKIRIPERTALLLALLYAIHPVLTQTVAWIPGRNDLILVIFLLATLIFTIDFFNTKRWLYLAAQCISCLLALLTKETAVIIPVITLLILRLVLSVKIPRMWPVAVTWALVMLLWYGLRATSGPSSQGMLLQEMLHSGIARIPAILQYLGKIFFPVNLAAVPRFEDITLVWGILSCCILTALVAFSGSLRKPLVITGLLWFLLFLLPVLTVPKLLNDQVYEHRLYIPFIGILLILSETILFSEKWNAKRMVPAATAVLLVFFTISFIRIGCFQNRQVFWDRAVADAPTSAFARLNQGIQSKDPAVREKYIRRAWAMDPKLMLVNYWMGITAERNKKTDSAIYFYRKELAFSNFPDLYFNLSRSLFTVRKFDSAAYFLSKGVELDPSQTSAVKALAEVYFKLAESAYGRQKYDSTVYLLRQVTIFDPKNEQASHNLAMVWFMTGHKTEALQVMEQMQLNNIHISDDLVNLAKQ